MRIGSVESRSMERLPIGVRGRVASLRGMSNDLSVDYARHARNGFTTEYGLSVGVRFSSGDGI